MDVPIEHVYGASKREQKTAEAPSSVTIVTQEEIRQFGYRTVADVLTGVRGFYTTYDRNYDYVGVRGFGRPADYNNRILVLIDGYRVNENVAGSSPIGTDLALDLDLIDRIEIVRGPGSSLYGTNALFGVVNIVTRAGGDLDAFEMEGQVGTPAQSRGRVTYGTAPEEGPEVLVSVTSFKDRGDWLYYPEFDDPATNSGRVDNDGLDYYNVFAKASVGKFTLTALHGASDKEIPTAPWDTVFADPRTWTRDSLSLVGLSYQDQIGDDFAISARTSYNEYNYDGWWVYDYAEDSEPPDIVVSQDYWKGQWLIGELAFTARPWAGHQITWGAEFQCNPKQEQKVWDEEVYLFDSRHSHNWALFVEDEYAIRDNLRLNAGVRFDEYVGLARTTNPRFALIYAHSDATTLKAVYGTAFRAPTAYELYYHDGGYSVKPSAGLVPETMRTAEFIVEHQLSGRTKLTAAAFHYSIEDMIDQYIDPADDLLVFRNLGRVTGRGLELEAAHRWPGGTSLLGSYCFTLAEDSETGLRPANSPKHLAKVRLAVPLIKDRLTAGLETCYVGSTPTLAGNTAGGFALTNLTLTYRNVVDNVDAALSLYNLFDTDYGYPGGSEHTQDIIAQDGIQAVLQVTYRF